MKGAKLTKQFNMLNVSDNRAQLFYWMFLQDKTPWYPSIQIFKKNINWDTALKNVYLHLDRIFKD